MDWKERQCLDWRRIKDNTGSSLSRKPPFIVPGVIHHDDSNRRALDKVEPVVPLRYRP